MTYEEFLKFVQAKCTYETIYSDSDGRNILVIKLLDAYGMVNKAQRPWVGLTDEELAELNASELDLMQAIESKLKSKSI
jgi:hypothetical protein